MENKKKDLKSEPIYEHQEVVRWEKTAKKKGRGKFAIECHWPKRGNDPLNCLADDEGVWNVWRRYKTAKQAQEALKGLNKHGHDFIQYRLGF